MKNRKKTGIGLLALGAVLFIGAVAANALGIGGAIGVGLNKLLAWLPDWLLP